MDVAGRLPRCNSIRLKRKLLLLDLEKVLCDSVGLKSGGPRRAVTSFKGVHTERQNGMTYLYQERPQLREFLKLVFKHFDVAIFTCFTTSKATSMINIILTPEEKQQLKFVFTQVHTFDTGIKSGSLDSASVLLKDLRIVWEHFGDLYDETTTVLIDPSPVRAFANPGWTGLFPSPFLYSATSDTFLLQDLWPLLDYLRFSNNVRCFLQLKSPKWSLLNGCRDRRNNLGIYGQLELQFPHKIWVPKFKETILDIAKDDISWDMREWLQSLGPLETVDDESMQQLVSLGIGPDYSGVYRIDSRKFLENVLHVRDTTTKFRNSYEKYACLKMRKTSTKQAWATCINVECIKCWKSTEFVQIRSPTDFILKEKK